MTAEVTQLTTLALSLPIEDRILLAQQLWDSLGKTPASSIENEGAAAVKEAQQRDEEIESGSCETVSHEQVMQNARKKLQCE